MTASARLVDYLGRGLAASLPTPGSITYAPNTAALYYATDTNALYALNEAGSAWVELPEYSDAQAVAAVFAAMVAGSAVSITTAGGHITIAVVISTDGTLGGVGASDTVIPSQKAIKTYVDAHGGGGGGGALTVTDGTTTESAVTTLTFSGASVSTTGAGEATVTITGGGGGGGGGGGAAISGLGDELPPVNAGPRADAYAAQGVLVHMTAAATLLGIKAFIAAVAGHTYAAYVYETDAAGNVISTVAQSAPVTIGASCNTFVTLGLTAPANLVSGNYYTLEIQLIGQGGTAECATWYHSGANGFASFPAIAMGCCAYAVDGAVPSATAPSHVTSDNQPYWVSPVWDNPAFVSGGGSRAAWDFSPPLASYFDTLWSGTGTNIALTDDAQAGLLFDCGPPSSGDLGGVHALRTLTTPADAWSMIAKMSSPLTSQAHSCYGLGLYNSSAGKILISGLAEGQTMKLLRLTPTGYNSEQDWSFAVTPSWFRADYDGSGTLSFYVSTNGKNWLEIYTEAVSGWLTGPPDKIGFGGDYNRGTGSHVIGEVSYFSLTGPAV
jgi:hypothetical protein